MNLVIHIGRTEAGNHIVAPDATVSSRHATLTLRPGLPPLLQDSGSTNGTFVNNQRVATHHLLPQDTIRLGQWHWHWHQTLGVDGRLHPTLPPRTVGRGAGNAISVAGGTVSGHHATAWPLADGTWLLVDAGSTNGTFANGAPIKVAHLVPGTHIRLGQTDWNWMVTLGVALPAVAPSAGFGVPVPVSKPASGTIKKRGSFFTPKSLFLIAFLAIGLFLGGYLLLYYSDTHVTPPSPEPYATDTNAIDPRHSVTATDLMRLEMACGRGQDFSRYYQACNFTHAGVRNLAVRLAGQHPGEFSLDQVCDLYDFTYQKWRYVNDPATLEYLSTASNTIQAEFNGDCDDFAVLLSSMVLAIGGQARICVAWRGEEGHAFSEVMLGTNTEENRRQIMATLKRRYGTRARMHYHTDDQNRLWLNLDWTATNPGGEYFPFTEGYAYEILAVDCSVLR